MKPNQSQATALNFILRATLGAMMVSALSTQTHAQESLLERVADGRSNCLDQVDCATTAGAATGATAVTIHTVRRYRAARNFDQAHTRSLLQSADGSTADQVRTSSVVREVADGDRVKVEWRLSDSANRQHHIELMDSSARSADSSAAMYRMAAANALIPRQVTKTEYYTDHEGKSQTRTYTVTEIDHAGYARNLALAAQSEAQAADYRVRADDARRGGPVPIYRFDETIGDAQGNRARAETLLNEKLREGGRVYSVTRLPAEQFQQLRRMVRSARMGVAGAVGLGALAVEEALLGKVGRGLEQMIGEDQGSVWYPSRDADRGQGQPQPAGTRQTLGPNVTR
ncbi:MAG TPA: hypothetical protein PLZ57_10665 [Pseudobdellovibrionaceae bacterium]|nr:hypothetical protein [Pseudobdellovibrionaceae bacterium]